MIRVSFKVTKEDLLAFSCHYYAISPTIRSARFTSQVSSAFSFAIIGVAALLVDDRFRPLGIIMLVCAGLSVLFYPRLYWSSLRTTTEKMIGESIYQKAFGEYTLELSEKGIASTSPNGQGNYTWGAISRVDLTPEYLFIFVAGPQGYAIQRSQVSDSTIHEVRDFVESHMCDTEPGD